MESCLKKILLNTRRSLDPIKTNHWPGRYHRKRRTRCRWALPGNPAGQIRKSRDITMSLLHVGEAATVSYLLCVSSFSSPVAIRIRWFVSVGRATVSMFGTDPCFRRVQGVLLAASSPKDSLRWKQVGSKCAEQTAEYSDGSKLAR